MSRFRREAPIRYAVKRTLDVLGAATALVVTAPLWTLVAIATRLSMGSPVLFRQPRAGLHGKPFVILKFRTMRPPREDEVWYRSDADRLTPVGRFVRRTSLDELPSLWNVIRGDMSLVGPRPLLLEYLERYTPEQNRRHEVLPGITGWAQVNGRQQLRFSQRLALDVWYVDHWSLALDLKILLMTGFKVLGSRGVILGQDVDAVDDLAAPPSPSATNDP